MTPNELDTRISPRAAAALAIGCTVGWGAFVMPGTTFLVKAGPAGSAIALLAGAALMAVIAVCLRYLLMRTLRNGGGFSYARTAFGRLHSYICGWSLAIAYIVIIPANAMAVILLARALRFTLFQQGPLYTVFGNDIYLLELAVVFAVLGGFALLATYGGRAAFAVQTVLVACLVGGVAIIGVAAILNPGAHAASFDPPFNPDVAPLAGIVSVASIVPWMFIGFGAMSQVAEQCDVSSPKASRGIYLALAVGVAAYLVLNTVAAVVPPAYESWADYVAYAPRLTGIYGYPVFLAASRLVGTAGIVVVSVTFLAAAFSGILGFYLATSRLLVAMSRGGVLSDWFGEVSANRHRPRHAMFFLFVASLVIACFGQTTLGWIVGMSSAGATVAFLYSCAAARTFAREEGNRRIFAVATAGVAISCLFLIILIVPIPGLGVSLGWESYLFVIAWAVLGFNFYTPRVPHHTPDEPVVIARLS